MARGARPLPGHSLMQWPGEAQFVAIRIGQVEEPLAPFGIARRRVRSITGRDHPRVEAVDVGMIEDDTSPPGPLSPRGLCDEIEKAGSSPKARKRRVITAMDDRESQRAVKATARAISCVASVTALMLSIIALPGRSSPRHVTSRPDRRPCLFRPTPFARSHSWSSASNPSRGGRWGLW